jgi:hypothetical protein
MILIIDQKKIARPQWYYGRKYIEQAKRPQQAYRKHFQALRIG